MDNITLTHTFLSSPDQDAAVDFYVRVLGLEVRTDVVMDGIEHALADRRHRRASPSWRSTS